MSISIQNNMSFAHSAMKANSVQSQAALTEDTESAAALPTKQSGNIAGKLNSLEHAATTNPRPMFLKGILQKMTDVKVRDLDIEQYSLTRSNTTLDAVQVGVQENTGTQTLTSEQMHLDSRNMSLAVQGTIQTKSGDNFSFDMQIGSGKIFAQYAALNYQANAPSDQDVPPTEPNEPVTDQIDTTA